MIVPDHEGPMDRPFDLERFKDTEFGQTAMKAIADHADKIVEWADRGFTPLLAIIPTLEPLVSERHEWVKVEWMLRDWLSPQFHVTGRMWVPTVLPHKGFCYSRVLPD